MTHLGQRDLAPDDAPKAISEPENAPNDADDDEPKEEPKKEKDNQGDSGSVMAFGDAFDVAFVLCQRQVLTFRRFARYALFCLDK